MQVDAIGEGLRTATAEKGKSGAEGKAEGKQTQGHAIETSDAPNAKRSWEDLDDEKENRQGNKFDEMLDFFKQQVVEKDS